jgi:hypothetical protein
MFWYVGPVPGEHAATKWIYLDLAHHRHPGALQTEFETTYACEKR